MKKLLSLMACVLTATLTYAQGTVSFQNTAATLIKYNPAVKGGVAVEVGQFRVGLYYAAVDPANPNTPPSLSAMTLLNDTGISPVAGRFLGGTQTTPATTPAGSDAWFAVRAWSTGYASWSAAFGSGNPSVFVSFNDSPFKNVTGGAGNPAGPPQALSGFTGINSVAPVPEPSVVALGILGAAALLLRRRK